MLLNMKINQTVLTEKELRTRWLNAEAHLRKGYICKHGIDHTRDNYCRKCLKQAVI